MRHAIRNVFDDPDIGDAITVDGDLYTVKRIERHAGKTYVIVQINGGNQRFIHLESWREYKNDPDTCVATNRSVVEAFG